MATDLAMIRLFGSRKSEHEILVWPAAFLVFGCVFLFIGFAIGITLLFGVLVRHRLSSPACQSMLELV